MADESKASIIVAQPENNPEFIKLRVVAQDSSEIHFRVKMTASMLKIMKNYAKRLEVPLSSLRFAVDGERIKDADTPASLGLENDDIIDVFQQQVGGHSWVIQGQDYNNDYLRDQHDWTVSILNSLFLF